MRHWSVPPLLALLCVLASLATLRAADDPGGQFLQAYQAFQAARQLEADARLEEALQKYRFCTTVLTQIQAAHPEYEPIVVDFRLRKSRESVGRVQQLMASASPPGMTESKVAADSAPVPATRTIAPPALPALSTGYRIPIATGLPPRPTAASVAPQRPVAADTSDEAIARDAVLGVWKDRVRSLQIRLNQERQINEDLSQKLLESVAREQSAQTETDRTKVAAVEAKSRAEQLQRALEDLQQTNTQLERAQAADGKRISDLEADLEVANEYNDELFTKLETAAKFIDASEKIRQQLLTDRTELNERSGPKPRELEKMKRERDDALAAKAGLEKRANDAKRLEERNTELARRLVSTEQQVLDIASDRDQRRKAEDALRVELGLARKERDEQVKQVDVLRNQSGESIRLAEQNKTLAGKLAAAEQQLSAGAKTREEREKLEQGLRAEMASVNATLADMRSQMTAGGKRIAELEKQLSDTASATATTTGAMAEENALLKSLVNRQLGEQARRQQARRLVEEEMEKLQVRSGALVEKLASLGKAETDLTPREKKLFEAPMAPAGGGVDFSLVITKYDPQLDLPPDLAERAKAANALAQQGQLTESRAIYAEIAEKAPQSFFAAINLGITERRLGNYPQAIDAFKRARTMKPEDVFTLTNLGGAQFRGGDVAGSIETLHQAVASDPSSYLAHYLLALALNEKGDAEEARNEVSRALDLKPDYLPAVQLSGELGASSASPPAPVGVSEPSR